MTRPGDLDATTVARYFCGESTPSESALVEAWLASDPGRQAEFEDIRRAWSTTFPLERRIDVAAAWEQVARQIHDTSGNVTGNVTGNITDDVSAGTSGNNRSAARRSRAEHHDSAPLIGRSSSRPANSVSMSVGGTLAGDRHTSRFSNPIVSPTVLRAAALAIFALGSAGAYRYLVQTAVPSVASRTTRQFAAAPGQRAIIDLADGTHIVLAPSTHLTLSMPVRGVGLREAILDGEAIFSVTHDSARPFVVRSRYGNTMDVGTSFAVRAYPDAPYRVAVREGRVELGDGRVERSAVLVAGDVAVRGSNGEMQVTHGEDVAQMLDWSSGRLTFDHRRFAELVPDLERWYGVRIQIASPALRERTISGQFDTESRSEVFSALGRALGARHTVNGSTVTFSMP